MIREKINIEDRLNQIKTNNFGTLMKVIKYTKSTDIEVQFLDDHQCIIRNQSYNNFLRGTIKNPYDKTMYDIGFLGEGEYVTTIDNVTTKVFYYWSNMMKRCYSKTTRDKNTAYYNIATVCEEWHNFQNFAKWFSENIYEYHEGRLHIDKDILGNDSKIYSPDTCVIIPQRINMIFMNKPNVYGLPSGIRKNINSYTVSYSGKRIGTTKTLIEAIRMHDTAQLEHVKEVANKYKNKIPEKVYNILMNWMPKSLREFDK